MRELKAGQIVCSTAGHDKNQFYIINRVEGEYVFLVDGKYKLLSHPKKKRKKQNNNRTKNRVSKLDLVIN